MASRGPPPSASYTTRVFRYFGSVRRIARRASWLRRRPSSVRKPFTTSFSVPSPPTATTVLAPAASASRAKSVARPRRSVRCTSNAPPSSLRRSASCARQRRPVFPFEEAGFTMKTVSAAMVFPERAMRPDELRVGRDLVLDGARIPSEDPAHPGGDLHRDAERLIRGLVEEPEPAHQDVGQAERHLLTHRELDLRPDVRPPMDDSVARPGRSEIPLDRLERVSHLEV